MPTATPFTALGVGNGFPFCLTKVDVSGYDYWTTLSGWSKVNTPADDTAKAASIVTSRRLAMKIYWNLYSMGVDIDTSIGGGTINQSASLEEVTMLYYPGITDGDTGAATDNPYAEPMARVCGTRTCAATTNSNPGGISYTSAYAQVTSFCVALYNGSTDNPDLFVGYGIVSNLMFARGISSSTRARAIVAVNSYGDFSTDTSTQTYDHAYTTLDVEFNIFCKVTAQSTSSGTRTANASGLFGSASSAAGSSTYSASSEITSLDFYTY
jgi:hypothetical protein